MSSAFSDIFGGDTLYPADLSYRAITLTASTTLQWPTEASAQTNLVAAIMDVTASAGPLVITMPPATEVSTGTAVIFNNVGASTFVVNDNGGAQIVSVASGEIWTAYVTSNATAAGTWETYQNGAGTRSASAAALAGYGLKAITTTLNQTMPVTLVSMDFTADATYRAGVWVWTGGAGVASLTSPATLGNDWFTNIKNSGSGNLVLTPLSGTIDGTTTVTLGPDESAIIVTDGTDFYTIGLTPIPVPGFDYVAIAVPGTGNYTLTGTELGRISYAFTGILTGNRTIIVPATVQQYWVSNDTTGAYTLTVKTASGTGVVVPAGLSLLLRCDGTNVIDATTGRVAFDLPTSTGSDTIAITTAPFGNAYYDGLVTHFIAGGTTTGAATLNVNGIGAATFQKLTAALAAGDITAGDVVTAIYKASAWQLQTPTRTPVLLTGSNLQLLQALSGVGNLEALQNGTATTRPKFAAYNSADDTNQTGNGANVTVDFDTEIYDIGGLFASDTLTVVVDGAWALNAQVAVFNFAAGTASIVIQLVTSNRTYERRISSGLPTSNVTYAMLISSDVDMDAGDTAFIRIQVNGMAGNTCTIGGGSTLVTFFNGHMLP